MNSNEYVRAEGPVNTVSEVAARILCCPDCDHDIGSDLSCPLCGRSFVPQQDGIISALPKAMQGPDQDKEHLQNVIAGARPEEQNATIVLYERAFHDEQARYYDSVFADPLPLGEYYRHLVRHVIYSYVRRQPFVVDLCCGTGKSSIPLVERGVMVVGMDVSREMLHIYKRKCEAKGYKNVLLVHSDASRPPLRKNTCGAITLIGGLHHIPEREQCVDRCCNALTKDGILILHEPLKTGRTSSMSVVLGNIYAASDPVRVWTFLKRRVGLAPKARSESSHEAPLCDFTPYERPFTSGQEVLGLMPDEMQTVTLRSQGVLSFRELPHYLQSRVGLPIASIIVRLDEWLGRTGRTNWSGDAVFAVFRKGSGAQPARSARVSVL